MEKIIRLWKPVELSNKWKDCDTSILDDISSSWFEGMNAKARHSEWSKLLA